METPYQYKMVQLPHTFVVKKQTESDIAPFLENLVNEHSLKGWDFYRIDSVGVAVNPGCLAGLLGNKQTMTNYNVVCFRKKIATSDASI